MSVIIKCDYKNENYNTLFRIDGNFKYSSSDVDFLLPQVTKLNFRADRITFTKILNLKNQVVKLYRNNILYKSKDVMQQCASAQTISDILKYLVSGTNIKINFKKERLAYQGVLSIENPGHDIYEIEADKSLLFCLGLLDLNELKGRFVLKKRKYFKICFRCNFYIKVFNTWANNS